MRDYCAYGLADAPLVEARHVRVRRGRGAELPDLLRRRGVTGVGAQFLRANLRRSDFRKADLTNANLSGADLTGASFQGAILAGADFSNVRGYSPKLMKDACGDKDTKLPAGASLRSCPK